MNRNFSTRLNHFLRFLKRSVGKHTTRALCVPKIFREYFILLILFIAEMSAVTVDLRDPRFSDGVLSTSKGGVITAPGIRVQAREITFTRKNTEEGFKEYLEAQEDLVIEYGNYVIVGRRIEYDFADKKGIVYDARAEIAPWFVGGKEIRLCPDGSYLIFDGFATTVEGGQPEWAIKTKQAHLAGCILSARNTQLRVFDFTLLWIPQFRVNLNSIFNSPFRYTVRFGGVKGTRLGISYEAFNWRGIKTRLLLDYRFSQGLGGGVDINYKSANSLERFHSVNYMAKDITTYDDRKRTRYRYTGIYKNYFECAKTSIFSTYDVLSDKEMASDFADKGLRLVSGRPTQVEVHRQESNWILNLLGRFRVNRFQTVKQELPTFSGSIRPFLFGNTGIISDNRFRFSYLELEFTDDRPNQHDFNSPRYEVYNNFYRPFKWGHVNITPQVGAVSIFYGNNPEKYKRWTNLGLFDLDLNTNFYKLYGDAKHVVTPYARYSYYTHPETSPDEHFIFDVSDGWYRMNLLRTGIINQIYTKSPKECIYRKLFTDLSLLTFFDTPTIPKSVYKASATMIYNVTAFMRNTLRVGWDVQRNLLDHWNYRLEWTINSKAAFAAEYRHRSRFDWRKVDHTNYILDSFRTAKELVKSDSSDRRDTFLLSLYYRFHPNWALFLQSRNGWNRKDQPNYCEYEINLLGRLRSSWKFNISYRHREDDDRFSVNFAIGLTQPDLTNPECTIPCLEF